MKLLRAPRFSRVERETRERDKLDYPGKDFAQGLRNEQSVAKSNDKADCDYGLQHERPAPLRIE
jgi:hypothetical protein